MFSLDDFSSHTALVTHFTASQAFPEEPSNSSDGTELFSTEQKLVRKQLCCFYKCSSVCKTVCVAATDKSCVLDQQVGPVPPAFGSLIL